MRKPILCLDFDGVIHSYESGWKGADVVPDAPVPGAMAFIIEAVEQFEVHIYSSRSGQTGGITAMQDWLHEHMTTHFVHKVCDGKGELNTHEMAREALAVEAEVKWPTEKPPAMISIDDRCLTFTGIWPGIDELKAFKPWNKGGVAKEAVEIQRLKAALSQIAVMAEPDFMDTDEDGSTEWGCGKDEAVGMAYENCIEIARSALRKGH